MSFEFEEQKVNSKIVKAEVLSDEDDIEAYFEDLPSDFEDIIRSEAIYGTGSFPATLSKEPKVEPLDWSPTAFLDNSISLAPPFQKRVIENEPFGHSESTSRLRPRLTPTIKHEVKEESQCDDVQPCSLLLDAANIPSDEDPEADVLRPRICLSLDTEKGEREQMLLSEVLHHREFERWRPTMILDPKPGNIFFCKASISDRESIHAADGISWSSSGRTSPSQIKNAKTFYYVANPKLEAMSDIQKEKFCVVNKTTLNKKLKGNSKKISYRKVLTYYIDDNFFMIEYYGDVNMLPWKKRSRVLNITKDERKLRQKERPSVQSQSQPDDIVESEHQPEDARGKHEPENAKRMHPPENLKRKHPPEDVKRKHQPEDVKRSNGSQSSSKFTKAVVFDNSCQRTKYTDLRTINKLLNKQFKPALEKINDAQTSRIMNPRAGEIYLMDLSNLSSWRGVCHCDIYCWRNKYTQHWKEFGFITQSYIYVKNARRYTKFKKTLHYSPGQKMALIHYYGSDDTIPKSVPFHDQSRYQ